MEGSPYNFGAPNAVAQQPVAQPVTPGHAPGEIGWDDNVTEGANNRTAPPAGEYRFVITNFQRGTYQPKTGSAITQSCGQAILELCLWDGATAYPRQSKWLVMHTTHQWLIDLFARSVGFTMRGQAYSIGALFKQVVGMRGFCMVDVTKQESKKNPGQIMEFANVSFRDVGETTLEGRIRTGEFQDIPDWVWKQSAAAGASANEQPPF